MAWNDTLRYLADVLALWIQQPELYFICSEVDIPYRQLDLAGPPDRAWRNVLSEAHRLNRLAAVLEAARDRAPILANNPVFQRVLGDLERGSGPPASGQEPTATDSRRPDREETHRSGAPLVSSRRPIAAGSASAFRTQERLEARTKSRDRFVNVWLKDGFRGGRVDPGKPLIAHWTYSLQVNVGPWSPKTTVRHSKAIPGEALQPLVERGGDQIEVVVASPHFRLEHMTPGPPGEEDDEEGPDTGDRPAARARWASVLRTLWLPVSGSSQTLSIAATPLRTGLCFLRIALYYRNQLLQSLRLDTRVKGDADGPLRQLPGVGRIRGALLATAGLETVRSLAGLDPAEFAVLERQALSRVALKWLRQWRETARGMVTLEPVRPAFPELGRDAAVLERTGLVAYDALSTADAGRLAKEAKVPLEQALGWIDHARRMTRLGHEALVEFTISVDLDDLKRLRPRTVSIFTNQTHGHFVVGLKLGEGSDAVPSEVRTVDLSFDTIAKVLDTTRTMLDAASRSGGLDVYRFNRTTNNGQPEDLYCLKSLAREGHRLYKGIFDRAARQALSRALKAADRPIQVSRLADGQALPWALLYNLELDTNPDTPLELCHRFQDHIREDRLEYQACRERADCPLNTEVRNQVVCPWGFWGFKHQLEQPAQRVSGSGNERAQVTELRTGGDRIRLAMGVNTSLSGVTGHQQALEALPNVEVPIALAGAAQTGTTGREQVLRLLKRRDLHIIYFYCHGDVDPRGSQARPVLRVGAPGEPPLYPEDLQADDDEVPIYDWPQHPLVIINGCRTTGLDPRLLSSFVRAFMENGAAGVIGTEVRVWEPLATWFAETFLADFLRGIPAGTALQRIRHSLLSRNNPLGLVYTLYCSIDLHLVVPDRG